MEYIISLVIKIIDFILSVIPEIFIYIINLFKYGDMNDDDQNK